MMKRVKKITAFILSSVLTLSLCMTQGIGTMVVRAEGEGPDPVATLQTAFATFNASQALYMDYTAKDGSASVHEKVELDKKNKIRSISSENVDSGKTTQLYVDIKAKITYTQKSKNKWEKNPADSKDLESIGRVLSANGIEPGVVAGVTYTYEGDETVPVSNAHTDEDTDIDCYVFAADIPVASTSDDSDGEEDEEEDSGDDEDAVDEDVEIIDDGDDGIEQDVVTVYYYVAKDSGVWVYAANDDVNLSIVYPGSISLSLPKNAKKSATLKNGYVMTYKGVKYKVQVKKKKTYLVASGCSAKSKLTVEKTVKILGKKYKVTEIGNNAFAKKSKLKTLVVKANITKIGKQAFYNSKKLKSITLKSASIKSVGKNAFKNVPKSATVKVPSKKKADYSKKFKKAGFKGKVK